MVDFKKKTHKKIKNKKQKSLKGGTCCRYEDAQKSLTDCGQITKYVFDPDDKNKEWFIF